MHFSTTLVCLELFLFDPRNIGGLSVWPLLIWINCKHLLLQKEWEDNFQFHVNYFLIPMEEWKKRKQRKKPKTNIVKVNYYTLNLILCLFFFQFFYFFYKVVFYTNLNIFIELTSLTTHGIVNLRYNLVPMLIFVILQLMFLRIIIFFHISPRMNIILSKYQVYITKLILSVSNYWSNAYIFYCLKSLTH